MIPEYLALAHERASTRWPGYRQPEDFGYDFRAWVSPYTKGACHSGGIALVLQDWASSDALSKKWSSDIQEFGRDPQLLTNRRLEAILKSVFGCGLPDVYATNIFPFVKGGSISAPLAHNDVIAAARRFALAELAIARPTTVIAVGRIAHAVLEALQVEHLSVPHPAARIGSLATHISRWRVALGMVPSVEQAG